MQMQDIFRTLTKLDHKHDIYFTYANTTISWRSVKTNDGGHTSSNHSKILAMHEVSRECVWLRSMIQYIRESCGFSSINNNPTVLYEDNVACIVQMK